jgi:hypothetical protein
MRRVLVTAVLAIVALATLAPPVFAQAPAPKVTITGLFDQVTSMGKNFYDGNYSRDNDREWYARTRFRPDFVFEVGRTKAVLGLEIDLMYGQGGANDGGFPGNVSGTNSGCKPATNGCMDLNTDVGGMIEIKWIYTEFDLTGKDGLLPFIPVTTVARAGGQPFGTIGNYKVVYANGDFAGLDLYTTFTPQIKNHLAFVVVEDELAGNNRTAATARTNRGEDYAFILSPEITPFKGLDIKPVVSWFHADGVTSGSSRRNATNRRTVGTAAQGTSGGMNSATATGGGNAAGDATNHENRYTLGLDARWRMGPFGLDPSLFYQTGSYYTQAQRSNGQVSRVEGDTAAWLFDVIGSFRTGPLLLEVRGVYTTGNKARDNLSLSKRYFEPLNLDTGYWAGWAAILALGVDYFNGGGGANQGLDSGIGYDRYGRAGFGVRATYSVTPALAFYGTISPTWAAEKVDTDTGCGAPTAAQAAAGCANRLTVTDRSWVEGDSRYIGTEVDLGMTWRFAPNTALDLLGAYLFAGSALDTVECSTTASTSNPCGSSSTSYVKKEANDAYYMAARVRFSF